MTKGVAFIVLLLVGCLMAQRNENESQPASQPAKGQQLEQGCVARSSGHYILMQSEAGHSYVLEASRKTNLGHYLGHQVEVAGTESATLGTSSSALRTGGGPGLTIWVDSIKVISKRCTH